MVTCMRNGPFVAGMPPFHTLLRGWVQKMIRNPPRGVTEQAGLAGRPQSKGMSEKYGPFWHEFKGKPTGNHHLEGSVLVLRNTCGLAPLVPKMGVPDCTATSTDCKGCNAGNEQKEVGE